MQETLMYLFSLINHFYLKKKKKKKKKEREKI